MDSPNKQKAEGTLDEAKGKVKQAVGDLTGNRDLHAEGQAEEASGRVKQALADGRKAVKDLVD
ncbi:MAG: CsbD family protein [Bacteroidota bacterium]